MIKINKNKSKNKKGDKKMENNFGVITIKQFAKEIGKPESTVRTWRLRGDIPKECFKVIAGTVFVRVKEIKEWFAA